MKYFACATLVCITLALLLASCGKSGANMSNTPTGTGSGGAGSGGTGSGGSGSGSTGSSSGTDIVTYHNDNSRTGQNLTETVLTTSNVNSSSFGKLANFAVDGKVDAQPLSLTNLTISGGTHNVLYVATEHDTVYAFDANSGNIFWQKSMIGSGETTSDDHGCGQVTPEIGVTSTPAIDKSSGTIYIVAMSKNGSGAYLQRLHALDVTSGAEKFGGPMTIQASYPGTGDNSSGGNVIFDPGQYEERAGLLLMNGIVYTTWTSHCDFRPYTGWVIAYNATTLAQTSVLNLTPNGSEGAIWMAGTAPAADSAGNIYLLAGNGTFDTTLNASGFPSGGDYGNSFLKISTSGGLKVADYFATFDTVSQSNADADLGSGGVLLLPDLMDGSGTTKHLAIGAGKDSNIYVVDRDNMGKFNTSSNNIHQQIGGALGGGVFSKAAYFNGTVYYGAVGDAIKAFSITSAQLSATPVGQTGNGFGYPGSTPSITANGSSNGIVWAAENASAAVLHAYDASDLSKELYNSNQAGSRDQFGAGNKFITPTIVNGKVYVGTTNSVGVFGLLK